MTLPLTIVNSTYILFYFAVGLQYYVKIYVFVSVKDRKSVKLVPHISTTYVCNNTNHKLRTI